MIDKKQEDKKENIDDLEQEKQAEERQIKLQNKQIKTIFIVFGAIIVFIVIGYVVIDSVRNFEYKGVGFTIVKEEKLIFYRSSFPIYSKTTGELLATYNIFIRNDPRELKDINFNGNLNLLPTMVVNATSDFNCDGYGNLAMTNFVKLHSAIGTKVMKDDNVSCSRNGGYMFVRILEGEETYIEQTENYCYDLYVNNCEILEATERFMVESLITINE